MSLFYYARPYGYDDLPPNEKLDILRNALKYAKDFYVSDSHILDRLEEYIENIKKQIDEKLKYKCIEDQAELLIFISRKVENEFELKRLKEHLNRSDVRLLKDLADLFL
jgi:hypothetical protein